MSNFLHNALVGKDARVEQLAVKILNVYLTSPLSSRDDTAENRRARLRKLVEEAVRTNKVTTGR